MYKVDDTLGVFHTHAVAGVLGGILTGIFATEEGCAAYFLTIPGGAVAGNGRQIGVQIAGALFIIAWNIFWTSLILFLISRVVSLRMTEAQMEVGDDSVHGEEAYAFYGDGQRRPTPDGGPLSPAHVHVELHERGSPGLLSSPSSSSSAGAGAEPREAVDEV